MRAAVEKREPDRPSPDLAALVGQLPEKQRQVVTLFYMQEKSYEEVAQLLDLPMGTVKTHLFRARKELALRWGKENTLKEKTRKENADAVREV
jgi:RNA polymerase sigma-70 factor (ECF subfamily)